MDKLREVEVRYMIRSNKIKWMQQMVYKIGIYNYCNQGRSQEFSMGEGVLDNF